MGALGKGDRSPTGREDSTYLSFVRLKYFFNGTVVDRLVFALTHAVRSIRLNWPTMLSGAWHGEKWGTVLDCLMTCSLILHATATREKSTQR